jgi:hypothetical protein
MFFRKLTALYSEENSTTPIDSVGKKHEHFIDKAEYVIQSID